MPEIFRRAARIQLQDILLEGLRVQFKVEKIYRSIPSKVELKVYNLASETHNRIVAVSRERARAVPPQPGIIQPRKRVFVGLDAGYEGNLTRLFYGDVFRVRREVQTPDIISVVSAQDGGLQVYSSRVNRSFAPGTSVEAVALHLVEALGVEPGNASEVFRGVRLGSMSSYSGGTVLSGTAANELDRICISAGLEWSIQEGRFQANRIRDNITPSATLLSPETGLIGSPVREEVSRLVKGRCFILPDVSPGRLVEVQSKLFKSVIRVFRTVISGDTHGNDWYIDFEGYPPRPPIAERAIPA
jgi:hypothetical protein